MNVVLNKKAFFVALIAIPIVFQEAMTSLNLTPIRYVDELLASFSFVLIGWHILTRRKNPKIYFLILFGWLFFTAYSFFFGMGSSYISEVLQMLIHFKFFLFYVLFRWVFLNKRCDSQFETVFYWCFIVSVLGIVLNVLLGDRFWGIFAALPNTRDGSYRYEGFQLKPNDVAFLVSLWFLYVAFKASLEKSTIKIAAAFGVSLVLLYLNGSRTALLIYPMVMLAFSFLSLKYRLASILICLVAIPGIMATDYFQLLLQKTEGNIGEFSSIESSSYIRAIMIYNGFKLLVNYFPMGTGAGTFGSVMSEGSVVYDQLGIGSMSFFEDMWGVYDSNLATICGEFGFVGLMYFYVLLPFSVYKDVMSLVGEQSYKVRYVRFYVMSILFFGLFVSVTNPFFMYQYNSTIFIMAMFLARNLALKANNRFGHGVS